MAALLDTTGLRGELRSDEPMSKHTSWRVGGPADFYYLPQDMEDVANFLAQLPGDIPVYWVGLGSNLLVRDGGIRGAVISTSGLLNEMNMLEKNILRAEAGVSSAKVARFSVEHGLTGAEFLAGIPGTIGGALAMNAGAFGGETWNVVCAVDAISRDGNIKKRMTDEFEVGYRYVKNINHHNEWFAAGYFKLEKDLQADGKAKIKKLLSKRGESQPTQLPNAGSVFKNPKDDHAARLIESCGLKGLSIGGASVSDKHANFIINNGKATAFEIEKLIHEVQGKVSEQFDVTLETEVKIIGESQ